MVEKEVEEISVWDSLFSTSHVFLVGVAIGAFLTYHYLVKKPEEPSASDVGLKTQEFLNLSSSATGSWRDSNPDLVTEQINNRGRRRSSLLYH